MNSRRAGCSGTPAEPSFFNMPVCGWKLARTPFAFAKTMFALCSVLVSSVGTGRVSSDFNSS